MKKYLMGMVAVFMAVTMSAFTLAPGSSAYDGFFWYDAGDGELLNQERMALPPNGCQLTGDPICAYGHINETSSPGVNPDEVAFYDE